MTVFLRSQGRDGGADALPAGATVKSLVKAGRSSAMHENGNDDTAITRTENAITYPIGNEGGAAIMGGKIPLTAPQHGGHGDSNNAVSHPRLHGLCLGRPPSSRC